MTTPTSSPVTRAKFKVTERTERPGSDKSLWTVKLSPVVSSVNNAENAMFYLFTPGGSITLETISAAAATALVPGKSFYVDFTETPQ